MNLSQLNWSHFIIGVVLVIQATLMFCPPDAVTRLWVRCL